MFAALVSLFRFWFQPLRVSLTERRWRRLAESVRRETFLTWLAEQVAKDMLNRKPADMTIEELAVAAKQSQSTDAQHQAERFIEEYYFDYPFSYCDEECGRTLEYFRSLIQQRLLRLHPH